MSRSPARLFPALAFAGLVLAGPCRALTITVDYSDDAAAMNFFASHAAAKAALNAAAADLSAVLGPTQLSAISPTGTPNVNLISGINGSTRVDADWDLVYTNPSTGVDVTLPSPTLAQDAVTIYAGLRPLGTSILGAGSPGGGNLSLSASGQGAQLGGAMTNLQTASNAYMGRGAGPVINTFAGSISLGASSANFSLTLGVGLGQISFNNDFDNNGVTDSVSSIDSLWHYDHTTPVAPGKVDFYSIALHELVHTVGFGASDTWNSLVSGTTWLGPHAAALNGGSGANLIDADGSHLRSGLMSTSLATGQAQEAAMDPSQTVGTRKKLTAMDVALLQDMGFSVAPVPEPGAVVLLAAAFGCLGLRRARK